MDEKQKPPARTKHRGGDHTSPYPVSRLAPSMPLVDLAREIEQADAMLNTRVGAKLEVIAEQIRSLQNAARTALEEAQRDQALHRAECQFQRRPGGVYHLYRRADGRRFFSLLSVEDWHGPPPHTFEASYRLENDMSWTPLAAPTRPDDSRELVRRLLGEETEDRGD